MFEHIVLGIIQGITEWLPISSEGVITVIFSELLGGSVSEAISYALWLHAGTALSATVSFRLEILKLIGEIRSIPKRPSNLFRFLLISTATSALVSIPLLIVVEKISESAGISAMVIVGTLMLVTGGIQFAKPNLHERRSDETSLGDSLIAGLAQGLSILPGLSRSGLTVSALLFRHVDKKTALTMSFMMSIPASIAASTYVLLSGKVILDTGGIIAGLAAFIVGLGTIHGLINIANRMNFGTFTISVGVVMLAGAAWQLLAS